MPSHEQFMRRCIELAREAEKTKDTLVGSLVVLDGRIIGEGVEAVRAKTDLTAHAEMEAIKAALKLLRRLKKEKSAGPFLAPVDPVALNVRTARTHNEGQGRHQATQRMGGRIYRNSFSWPAAEAQKTSWRGRLGDWSEHPSSAGGAAARGNPVFTFGRIQCLASGRLERRHLSVARSSRSGIGPRYFF